MVGGLSDASKSSKIKNRIFCEVDFLHVSQYNHVVSKSPKNPNLFYKPSFAPCRIFATNNSQIVLTKLKRGENLGILNTDHILQGDCLIWCCWFECNYTYESQFKMDLINNLAKGKLSLSICHGFSMKMIIIKVCHLSLGCHHNNHTLNKKKS